MNTTIKRYYSTLALTGVALLASAVLSRANIIFDQFDSASEAANYSFSGWNGSPSGTATFSTHDANGNSASGSVELQLNFSASGKGGAFVSDAAPVDVSTATNIEFDVMVDPTSPLDPAGNVCYFQGGFNLSGSIGGFKIAFNPFWLGPSGTPFTPGVWQHFKLPIPVGTLSSAESQFAIYPYDPNYTSSQTPIFYVDNIVFDTPNGPVPAPTMSLGKATKGLNVFASTSGLYDRESARLATANGQGWVGQATSGNPVTYSFTINGFPNVPVYTSEAYMFLIPNPVAHDNAPDYNEPNCIIAEVQSTSSGSLLILQYKANEADANAMQYGGNNTVTVSGVSTNNYFYTNAPGSLPGGPVIVQVSPGVTNTFAESGNLGSIPSTLLNGTYSLKFTSTTNVTIITPDGNSANFVISPYYAGGFASSTFDVYLGMQANTVTGVGQAVSYANFSISGTASPFSDNFSTDATLNTTNWDTSVASGPAGVLVVPATATYWVDWTLPAASFSLETGSNLLNLANWASPSLYPVIAIAGQNAQLVDRSEQPAGGVGFFNLVKRSFSQLQVLLPGETNAPGTLTGKVGTPTAVNAFDDVAVTINAVDASWHIINGASDTINLNSSGGAILPNPAPLVNGTLQEVVNFTSAGSFTVTATDTDNTNITSNTSSAITVQ